MAKFRKKPVVIEARQFPGIFLGKEDAVIEFEEWLESIQMPINKVHCRYRGANMIVPTLEGEMMAAPGDWIIRGVAGEIYSCKPDIFAATYDPVV